MTMLNPVPIGDQIAEVEREIRDRERRYPTSRLLPETQDRKLRQLRAAALSLRWLESNSDWIKPIAAQRSAMRDVAADIYDQFPDAEPNETAVAFGLTAEACGHGTASDDPRAGCERGTREWATEGARAGGANKQDPTS